MKFNMAGRVDQFWNIIRAIELVFHLDRMGFDGNCLFHAPGPYLQDLLMHLGLFSVPCERQHAVSQIAAFSMNLCAL